MSTSALTPSTMRRVPASRRPLRVLGIDLGTTNSTIAEILVPAGSTDAPQAHCIGVEQPTPLGPQIHTLVPSALAIHKGHIYVGAGATDLRAQLGDLKLERNRDIFWDCKNDIGVRRTYHRAQEGYRSAKEIGGHLLKFLMDAASDGDSLPADATVVTVPASFQAGQRMDTLGAAKLAGIELPAGALLDEPVAAFLDYVSEHGMKTFMGMSESRRLAVFDFGGGTCDVALFELRPPQPGAPPGVGVAPLAISRYHRLGGGDIDRAIVVEALVPQLLEQNALQPRELSYRDKFDRVIPALLGCAESLKIRLCQEITQPRGIDRYNNKQSSFVQKNPKRYPCTLRDGRTLNLQSPTLSTAAFDKILEPFLDRDLLYPRETDYLMTCSVFAPLTDTLTRADLEPKDIDFCLLVGGSALIPQIADAVDDFFSAADILRFDDDERTRTAVARGAAYQALSLAVHGTGIVRPITGSSINIQTTDGPVMLIPDGAELPYPSEKKWAESSRLMVPENGLANDVKLRVELRDGDERLLQSGIWAIPPVVSKDDPLLLRYRMDVNQVLHLHLHLARGDAHDLAAEFELKVENPLTSVVNPNAKRNRILELEEKMRTEVLSQKEKREIVQEIADLETDLHHYERALDLLAKLNKPTPDGGVLFKMGLVAGRMGDYEREEKFYREAAKISAWNGPLFNLALSQDFQGKPTDAMQTIDEAITINPDPPSLILKARLVDKLKQPRAERDALLERAFAAFNPLHTLSDFELSWYKVGAKLAGDNARQKTAQDEYQRRKTSPPPEDDHEGALPRPRNEIAGWSQ